MTNYAFGDEKCLCLAEAGDIAGCPVHVAEAWARREALDRATRESEDELRELLDHRGVWDWTTGAPE